jgi:iron complex outermembrane receptor protein
MPKRALRSSLAILTFVAISVLLAGPSLASSRNSNKKEETRMSASSPVQEKEKVAAQSETNVEVTVTAPRVEIPLKQNPAATTVVETPILDTMPRMIAIDEVMKLVPGVKIDNQADGERVHLAIRGEGILTERGTRGIKTLVDGIPLNDPSGYVSDFYDVDWPGVRRIEVLRGPAAAFYGSGSSGGIVNILTHDGGPDPIAGSATLVRGAFGLKKGFAELGGTAGPLNYSLTGSITSGDGYRDWSAYKGDKAHGKFAFTVNPKVRLTAVLGWTNFWNQNPEGLNLAWFSADPKTLRRQANPDSASMNEYQKTRRGTGGLTAEVELARSLDLVATAYFRNTAYAEAVPSTVIHRDFGTPGLSLQINYRSSWGRITNYLTVGADYAWQTIDELKYPNLGGAVEGPDAVADQTLTQTGAGVFVLDRLEFSRGWGIFASGRYDRVTNELADHLQAGGIDLSGNVAYKRPTGRVGVTWNPAADFGLYASWGTGFLPPGTEELVNNPYALGGYNAELVAATSTGEEVGARGKLDETLDYDVAVFYLATANDFGRYRIVDRPLETFYGNVGSTHRYGVEASVAWFPVRDLAVRAAYTYSHFKYVSVETLTGETYENTWLPNCPPHQLYVDAEYRLTRALTAGASLEYTGGWYIDGTNVIQPNGYGRTDPYTLAHVRLGYRFEAGGTPIDLFLSGRNIFNVLYYGFTEPDPDGNSYQPAPTAEWSLQLRLGWK